MISHYLLVLGLGILWNVAVWVQIRRSRSETDGTFRQMTAWGAWMPVMAGIPWLAGFNAYSGGGMLALSWVFPMAAFVSTAQVLRGWGAGRGRNAVVGLLALYNLMLGVVLTTRYLGYLGLKLPLALDGLLLDDAWSQGRTVFLFAMFSPVFVKPPLLLPLGGVGRKPWTVLTVLPAMIAFATVWDWIIVYPQATSAVGQLRQLSVPSSPPPTRPDFTFTARALSPLSLAPPPKFWQKDLKALDDLGAQGVSLVVTADILRRPGDLKKLGDELSAYQKKGHKLLLTCWGPASWYALSPDESALRDTMENFHARLLKVCRPDLLVPFGEPYGASLLARGRLTPLQWAAMAKDAARKIHAASPTTRVAFPFSDLRKEEWELCRALAAPDSGVDVLGFQFYPVLISPNDFLERRKTAERWLKEAPGSKPFWILETGLSPLAHGEAAQASVLSWLGEWSLRQPRVIGLNECTLGDYGENLGLITATGRHRPAFEVMRRLVVGS
ncbi:MAG TPA: hypothetical protein VGN26_24640 [Armatimonadota bacterium]